MIKNSSTSFFEDWWHLDLIPKISTVQFFKGQNHRGTNVTLVMFLIIFDLILQMQEKSRRSISKKVRNALVDLV